MPLVSDFELTSLDNSALSRAFSFLGTEQVVYLPLLFGRGREGSFIFSLLQAPREYFIFPSPFDMLLWWSENRRNSFHWWSPSGLFAENLNHSWTDVVGRGKARRAGHVPRCNFSSVCFNQKLLLISLSRRTTTYCWKSRGIRAPVFIYDSAKLTDCVKLLKQLWCDFLCVRSGESQAYYVTHYDSI